MQGRGGGGGGGGGGEGGGGGGGGGGGTIVGGAVITRVQRSTLCVVVCPSLYTAFHSVLECRLKTSHAPSGVRAVLVKDNPTVATATGATATGAKTTGDTQQYIEVGGACVCEVCRCGRGLLVAL